MVHAKGETLKCRCEVMRELPRVRCSNTMPLHGSDELRRHRDRRRNRRLVILSYICATLVILAGIGFGFITDKVHTVTKWIVDALVPAFVVPNVLKWHWWRFNSYGFAAGMIAGTAAAARSQMPAEEVKKRLAELEPQIQKIEAERSMASDLHDARQKLWPAILAERLNDGELSRRRLEMDLLAKDTRAQVLREQIRKIEQNLEEKTRGDLVLNQLRKVVELRKKALARLQKLHETNTISREEVAKGEEQYMEAEIRVRERIETLRQLASGDVLARLSGELANAMVGLAEMQSRLACLNRELVQMDPAKLDEKQLDRTREQYKDWIAPRTTPVETRLANARTDLPAEKMRLTIKSVRPATEEEQRMLR